MSASFNPATTALVLADLQNDFLHPKGAYGRAGQTAPAVAALPARLKPVVEASRRAGLLLVSTHFTLVEGRGGEPMISPHLKKLRPFLAKGDFASGSFGQALIDELKPADVAVEKTNGLGLKGFFTARLAFVSKRSGRSEVYTSDLFLGEAKQLTRDGAHVLTPRWSPDGARVVYTSFFRSNAPDVFASNVTSGARETLISFRGTNSGARFSPSGQQLALIMTGEGAPDLYVTNSQGRAPSRRTRSDAVKSSPCWSPDGSQIVFTMEPGPQLYVMAAAGGAPRRLAVGVSTYAAEPDWSRADRKIGRAHV